MNSLFASESGVDHFVCSKVDNNIYFSYEQMKANASAARVQLMPDPIAGYFVRYDGDEESFEGNDATIVRTNEGIVYLREYEDEVLFSWWEPDPVDAAARLKEAADYAVRKGERLRITAGTYSVGSTVKLLSNSYVVGDQGAILTIPAGARNAIFRVSKQESVVIDGVTFEGNRDDFDVSSPQDIGGYRVFAITINTSRSIKIKNCNFIDQEQSGIRIESSIYAQVVGCRFERFGFGSVSADDKTYGDYLNYDAVIIGSGRDKDGKSKRGCEVVVVEDNTFIDIGWTAEWAAYPDADAIQLDDLGFRSIDVRIKNNSFDRVANRCFKIQSGKRILFEGNTIQESGRGVTLVGDAPFGGVTIQNNSIDRVGAAFSVGGLEKYATEENPYVVYSNIDISNNTIIESVTFIDGNGIHFFDGVDIYDNSFTRPNRGNKTLQVRGHGVNIHDNEIEVNQSSSYGVRVLENSDGFRVANNVVRLLSSSAYRATAIKGYDHTVSSLVIADNRIYAPGVSNYRYFLDPIDKGVDYPVDIPSHQVYGNTVNADIPLAGSDYHAIQPKNGYWEKGTVVLNVDGDSNVLKWICEVSGRPGEWRAVMSE